MTLTGLVAERGSILDEAEDLEGEMMTGDQHGVHIVGLPILGDEPWPDPLDLRFRSGGGELRGIFTEVPGLKGREDWMAVLFTEDGRPHPDGTHRGTFGDLLAIAGLYAQSYGHDPAETRALPCAVLAAP